VRHVFCSSGQAYFGLAKRDGLNGVDEGLDSGAAETGTGHGLHEGQNAIYGAIHEQKLESYRLTVNAGVSTSQPDR
jgi:hypothetical protein